MRGAREWVGLLLFSIILTVQIEGGAIEEKGVTTRISVIFNTRCAKCHEGECSGRLSFETGSRTAARHIRQYAQEENLSQKDIGRFYALLNYMKEKCALYMPEHGIGKRSNLSHFALPSQKGYFLPLGKLAAGRYRLTLDFGSPVPFHLEVLSDTLENVLDQWVENKGKISVFEFAVTGLSTLFLRIRSRKALDLISVELLKIR